MTSLVPSFSALLAATRARYLAMGSTIRKYTTAAVITKLRTALSTVPHMIGMPLVTSPVAVISQGDFRHEL
ncbi:hypothetical protein SALBM135S_08736 [Streptomyces alboniger]